MGMVTNLVSCHLLFVPLFFKLNSLCSSSFLFCAIHPFPNCKISSHYFGFGSWFRIFGLRGLDWVAMTRMFHYCLASPPVVSASNCVEQNVGHEALEFDQEGVTL